MSKNQTKMSSYGGQAVIEGVMMRGSKTLSVAVRSPDGSIVVHTEPLNQVVYGSKLFKVPFVRGLVLLWDALGLGIKSLMFSADVAMNEVDEGETVNPDEISKAFSAPVQVGTVIFSLAMSVGLFVALPALIGELARSWLPFASTEIASHVVEGVVRLVLLVGYIAAIGLMEDVRRLYGYHGAEHKTINAYEAKASLDPETVATFPIEHPRCGTAFLLTVVLISIIMFSFLPLPTSDNLLLKILYRVGTRVVLIPVVAGIAFEYIRLTAKYQSNKLVQLLIKPNLALQRLTTRTPDRGMLEVGIAAFEQMRAAEESGVAIEENTIVIPGSVQPT